MNYSQQVIIKEYIHSLSVTPSCIGKIQKVDRFFKKFSRKTQFLVGMFLQIFSRFCYVPPARPINSGVCPFVGSLHFTLENGMSRVSKGEVGDSVCYFYPFNGGI